MSVVRPPDRYTTIKNYDKSAIYIPAASGHRVFKTGR